MSHSISCSPSFLGMYPSRRTQVSYQLPNRGCDVRANILEDLVANDTLFHVGVDTPLSGQGRPLPNDSFARWAIGPKPMYLNFSDPTLLNLKNTKWNPDYAVIPKDYPKDSWIYMVIYTNASSVPPSARQTVPGAHPVRSIYPIIQEWLSRSNQTCRFTYTATTLRFSSSLHEALTRRFSIPSMTILLAEMSFYSLPLGLLPSRSKPTTQALGCSIATLPCMHLQAWPCRYWSDKKMLRRC